MRNLTRSVILWLSIGTCFGQSSIYVATPGNIHSALKADIPPAAGQTATSFPVGFVTSVAADASGNIYFAVEAHNRVYRVTPEGTLFLIAGTESGYSGDGGPATQARLRNPVAVAVGRGALYIADMGNNAIRKISPDGIITTVAQGLGLTSTSALALDNADNLYLGTQNRLLRISPSGGVTAVAGTGATGFSGDGGPAIQANLGVSGVVVDGAGNIFISDNQNHRVRKITAGIITTIAGNGFGGYAGDGGPALAASLNQPRGLALDNAGNLYVADYFNHLIRRIDPTGGISTVAGRFVSNAPLGSGGYGGDGGPALQALMRNPMGLALDPFGNLYIADSNNRRVRKVVLETGIMSTAAGNGLLGGGRDTPFRSIAISSSGEIYLAGLGRMVYRLTPAGGLSVFAGTDTFGFAGDGGPATSASLAGPGGLAVDSAGNVYISDTNNHRVRRVATNGRISTFAGTGLRAFGGDGEPAIAASLSSPGALAVGRDGALYISDTGNRRLRKVTPDGIIQTIAGNGQTGFSGDGLATASSIGGAGGIVVDSSGAVILSDGNNRIRKITADGQIRTIAGTGTFGFNGDGPALSVNLTTPWGLAMDPEGTLYIADTNSQRVRRLTSEGRVETIAGTGRQGFSGDGGPAIQADIAVPTGIAWHPAGALYITDDLNGKVRRIDIRATAQFAISNSDAVSAISPGTGAAAGIGYGSLLHFGGDSPIGLAVISSRENGVTVSETTLSAAPPILSGRFAAEVNGPVNTGISLVNPNETTANVSFFFTNESGDFGSGTMTIGGRSQVVGFLTDPPFNLRTPVQGTFTFVSSAPLAVAALRGFRNERSQYMTTAVPVIDLGVAPLAEPVSIAHYASGGGWSTRLTLVNPSDQFVSGNIRFTDSAGNVTRQQTYSLTPRGSQTVPFEMNTASTSVGSALITPGAGAVPSAFALIAYIQDGVTLTSTAAAAVPLAFGFRMFAEISGDVESGATGSAQTAIAIANPSDTPVQVHISIGSVILFPVFPAAYERFTVLLPARGHFAAFLKDVLPRSIPLGPLHSVLRVQSSGPVGIMGLRTLVNERNHLLLSSTPAIQEGAPVPTGAQFFPLFADSPAFTTRFILFSGVGTSGGSLQFSSSSGQTITLIR
jgi:sugar lactone lactonase YvrE